MKKYKWLVLLLLVSLIGTTGCMKKDSLEGIEILTTVYPIEYITRILYGEHAIVNSIYPDGTDTTKYTLNKKQLDDYSKKELFIYNGLSDDKEIAVQFLDRNKNMLIIDSAFGMELTYGEEELWLNPSHLLMITQNVRNGLEEYITNSYLEKEIDNAYEELKVKLSELDAEIKLTAENASRKTIVVNNNVLKYLEKYGFEVISLDDRLNPVSQKTLDNVKKMIENKTVHHLFYLENTDSSDVWKKIVEETKVSISTYRRLDNISDTERDNKEDYISIMMKNIDLLREELY